MGMTPRPEGNRSLTAADCVQFDRFRIHALKGFVMNGKYLGALLVIVLGICVLFSFFSSSAIGAEADAKARAEGRVVLYSCPGRENVEPVVQQFERQHLGIKVLVSYGKGSQAARKNPQRSARRTSHVGRSFLWLERAIPIRPRRVFRKISVAATELLRSGDD